MDRLAVPPEALSPAAQKHVPPAPPPARMMAARGLAPLTPRDFLTVLTVLGADPEPSIAEAAQATFAKLPERILEGALRDRLDPAVLRELALRNHGAPKIVELLLLHPAIDDDAVYFLAQHAGERQLEIVAQNEMRLRRAPRIIEAMYLNPNTRMSTVDRVLELAVRNDLDLSGIPAFKEVRAAILGIREEEPPAPAPEPAAAPPPAPAPRLVAPPSPAPAPPSPAPAPAPEAVLTELEPEHVQALAEERSELDSATAEKEATSGKVAIVSLLAKMSPLQKIRWAQIGNKETRSILMRDSNKIIATSAIRNPRVTEQEVTTIAMSRSVNDEVIRVIAASRDWTKSYPVRLNLVNNPKCPLPAALQFLRTLRENDLRALAKNKNVPNVVATTARRLTEEKRR
jgi:hypothetical protein